MSMPENLRPKVARRTEVRPNLTQSRRPRTSSLRVVLILYWFPAGSRASGWRRAAGTRFLHGPAGRRASTVRRCLTGAAARLSFSETRGAASRCGIPAEVGHRLCAYAAFTRCPRRAGPESVRGAFIRPLPEGSSSRGHRTCEAARRRTSRSTRIPAAGCRSDTARPVSSGFYLTPDSIEAVRTFYVRVLGRLGWQRVTVHGDDDLGPQLRSCPLETFAKPEEDRTVIVQLRKQDSVTTRIGLVAMASGGLRRRIGNGRSVFGPGSPGLLL